MTPTPFYLKGKGRLKSWRPSFCEERSESHSLKNAIFGECTAAAGHRSDHVQFTLSIVPTLIALTDDVCRPCKLDEFGDKNVGKETCVASIRWLRTSIAGTTSRLGGDVANGIERQTIFHTVYPLFFRTF